VEIAIAIIEHALWPLVVFLCVLMLKKQLSALLERMTGLKAGSIELQFKQRIERQGFTPEQQVAFRNLSADEIDLFLLVSFSDDETFRYTTNMPFPTYRLRMLQLQEAGLLALTNPDDPGTNLLHNLTPLGKRVRALIVDSTVSLLRGVPS